MTDGAEARRTTAPRFLIGTQGWNYDEWQGHFYPAGTKPTDRLELYSRVFDTVEIDSTFYAMPPAAHFRSWYERTPTDFLFTVKLPRDITHAARLAGAHDVLEEFCNRAAQLEEKLGPLLVQLPPDLTARERPALEQFVRHLPRELEFAVEFRHASWFDERTRDFLERADVAMAVSVGPWLTTPQALRIAAHAPGAFQYLRWLGSPRHQELNDEMVHARSDDLAAWAARILDSTPDRPVVYAYFNNDYQGHSPDSARRLQTLVGIEPKDPSLLRPQGELF